jgi:hypothetical protein
MAKKLLAAVLGGLAFFAWSTIAHLFLGLGNVGISEIPNEQAVVSSVKANITQPGRHPVAKNGEDAGTRSQNESGPGRDHGCAS